MSAAEEPRQWDSRIPGLWVYLVIGLTWLLVLSSPRMTNVIGLGVWGPFFDLQGILAANEAKMHGMDPFAPNPLDAYERPFYYSTWWLWVATKANLTRADTVWAGIALNAATLVSAALVWPLRNRREALVAGLVLLSPAGMLAVYRANNDLVIFILLALAILALQRASAFWRAWGAIVAGGMVILKYYPATTLIAILRAPRRRELIVLLALAAGTIAAGWPSLGPALSVIARYGSPYTAGLRTFGATVLPNLFAPGFTILGWMLGLAAGFTGCCLVRNSTASEKGGPPSANRLMAAALGGAMMIGCFFIGTSFTYKLIFFWFILPWLVRDAPAVLGKKPALAMLALFLFVCWADGLALSLFKIFDARWTESDRVSIMTGLPVFLGLTQIACWILAGACFGLAVAWSRAQLVRLRAAGVG